MQILYQIYPCCWRAFFPPTCSYSCWTSATSGLLHKATGGRLKTSHFRSSVKMIALPSEDFLVQWTAHHLPFMVIVRQLCVMWAVGQLQNRALGTKNRWTRFTFKTTHVVSTCCMRLKSGGHVSHLIVSFLFYVVCCSVHVDAALL